MDPKWAQQIGHHGRGHFARRREFDVATAGPVELARPNHTEEACLDAELRGHSMAECAAASNAEFAGSDAAVEVPVEGAVGRMAAARNAMHWHGGHWKLGRS